MTLTPSPMAKATNPPTIPNTHNSRIRFVPSMNPNEGTIAPCGTASASPLPGRQTPTMPLPSNREDVIVPFVLLPTSRTVCDPPNALRMDITRLLTQTQRPRYNPPPFERPPGGSSPGRPHRRGKQIPTGTDLSLTSSRGNGGIVDRHQRPGYGQYRRGCQLKSTQGHASISKKRLEGALPPASTDSNGEANFSTGDIA